ncbi:sigma-70 family RNA polymerase sigma factor [Actinomadura graeca]|uniref:Sigma-70 family RNA polymerase sigma factor n=1 Tax=Actinomadura graeca TaxID=2750812 RepID=A0ABX8QR85_9ACTN|nr:sigma-70 family RNA polymerase sigma factor [Actinomadura graeca]QXJ20484.1 sigma-70 family RNA polymerase sigma factor [Actinomadura graeca]
MAKPESGLARAGGDPAALEAFYRRHIEEVSRFIARRVRDPHTAADLTAEVFLAVVDSAHTYRPAMGSELGWLYGVARNVVAAEHRRAARESRIAGRIAGRRLLDAGDIARLEERIDAESDGRRAYEALSGLPEGVRALLELITVDGLTVTEAAAALGIRPVTARVRLHRARKAVRAALPAFPAPLAYSEE